MCLLSFGRLRSKSRLSWSIATIDDQCSTITNGSNQPYMYIEFLNSGMVIINDIRLPVLKLIKSTVYHKWKSKSNGQEQFACDGMIDSDHPEACTHYHRVTDPNDHSPCLFYPNVQIFVINHWHWLISSHVAFRLYSTSIVLYFIPSWIKD